MLQDIRDKSQGIVVKIIVGFIVVTFALFGVDALVTSFNSSETVAEVDGVDITRTEMLQSAETQRRQLISSGNGQIPPELLTDNFLQSRALDELIQRVVLSNQAQNLGLGVSDSQIDAYLVQSEQFQTNGQFDQNLYLNFIRSLGFTPLAFKERIKQDVLIQQPRNAIAGSEFVLPYQVNTLSDLQQQQRSYDYVSFSLAEETENMSASDSELKAYYEENKENFKTTEQVKLDYVVISSSDFYGKVSVTDTELQDAYQVFTSEEVGEERLASHILIDSSRDNEDTLQRLEEVQAKLAAGESFSDLAAEYSDDIGSKNDGGNLGFMTKETSIDEDFSDVLFSMQVNEVKSVESQFGFHLLKLNEIVQSEAPSFESRKAELTQELLDIKAKDALLSAHEDITDLAYASDDLNIIAKEYGIDVIQTDYFGRQGGSDDITSNALVVAAAFDVSVLEDNQNSNLIELNDDQVAVLHLNDHKPEAFQTLEEVKVEVESIVVKEKALVSLQEKADATKSSTTIEWTSVSDAKRSQDELSSLAFTLAHPAGEPVIDIKELASGDLALIRLNNVGIDSEDVSDELTLAYEQYLNEIQTNLSSQGQQTYLQGKATIER